MYIYHNLREEQRSNFRWIFNITSIPDSTYKQMQKVIRYELELELT